MTATVWLQVLAGLGGIVSLWLREYYSAEEKVKRKEEEQHEAVQEGRRDIVDGNADAVAARIDRVCGEDGGDARSTGSADQAGGESLIQRLERLGIRAGKIAGKS